MSDDVSFDMMQRGGKVRVLGNEQFYEQPRELRSRIQVEAQQKINEISRETVNAFNALKANFADAERRVEALEQERRGGSLSDDLPDTGMTTIDEIYDERRHERGGGMGDYKRIPEPKSDEFYVKVDRSKGTVEDDR